MRGRTCGTCGAYLGGGACGDNLKLECADGGFQAWRPCERFQRIGDAEAYVHEIGHRGGFRIHRERDEYILRLDGEARA